MKSNHLLLAFALVLAPVISLAQAPPAGNFGGARRGYLPGGTDVAIADGGTGQSTATAAFDALASTTTAGDMMYHNGTGNVRLPAGTALQLLRMNAGATAPEWATASASGDVVGPASSINLHLALFDGTTGKLLRDDGLRWDVSTQGLARDGGAWKISTSAEGYALTIEDGSGDDAVVVQSGFTLLGSAGSTPQSQVRHNFVGGLYSLGVIESTVAAGTAPFTLASTTKVANLNADRVDGVGLITALGSQNIGLLSAGVAQVYTQAMPGVAVGDPCVIGFDADIYPFDVDLDFGPALGYAADTAGVVVTCRSGTNCDDPAAVDFKWTCFSF